jgi:hypothetical protein
VYDAEQRTALAVELADAFLSGPWRAEAIAESGAARLDRWPEWMATLSLTVAAVHRSRPRPADRSLPGRASG